MEVCVASYYLENLDWLDYLAEVNKNGIHVMIMSKRKEKEHLLIERELPFTPMPDVGLEFGSYDYYLKTKWRGGDTVFIHCDTFLTDTKKNPFIEILHWANHMREFGCFYVFRDEAEEVANGRMHGRCIFIRQALLEKLLQEWCTSCIHAKGYVCPDNKGFYHKAEGPHYGFWHDRNNFGHTNGKVPLGVKHYNNGIYHYNWWTNQVAANHGMKAHGKIYVPWMVHGRRNSFKHIAHERAVYEKKKKLLMEKSK